MKLIQKKLKFSIYFKILAIVVLLLLHFCLNSIVSVTDGSKVDEKVSEKKQIFSRDEDEYQPTTDPRKCTQRWRIDYLRLKCKENKDKLGDWYNPSDNNTYSRILVDDKHKVLYCAVAKAASTTFYNMFYLATTGRNLSYIHCWSCWMNEGLVWLSSFPEEERN